MGIKRHQVGLYLVEVLVAIFLLGVGVLALLAISVNSIRQNTTIGYRNIAVVESYRIADMLRANLMGLRRFSDNGLSSAVTTESLSCYQRQGCLVSNTNQLPLTEIGNWKDNISARLPGGKGEICRGIGFPSNGFGVDWSCPVAVNNNHPFVVKVCWDESKISILGNSNNTGVSLSCTYTQL